MSNTARPDGRTPQNLRVKSALSAITPNMRKARSWFVSVTPTYCVLVRLKTRCLAFLRGQNQGWLTAEYGMLPRSTHSRMDREAARGKQSGRTQEIQRLIGRALACSG